MSVKPTPIQPERPSQPALSHSTGRLTASPSPPGHVKRSGRTVPAHAPESHPHGRMSSAQDVGLPGHGGSFPAMPPRSS